ncbi:MAG TPA: flavin reductase [Kaistia sp.]|nr:flavin reductase [Kaistia sp.]
MAQVQQTVPEPGVSPVTAELYRDGMSRLAGAVSIVTMNGSAGPAGFTASAVCSITDSPPTLLVCAKLSSSIGTAIQENRAICVNTLAPLHEDLARLFGGKTPMQDRFTATGWTSGLSGAPILADALVAFDGHVVDGKTVGTHRILIVRVDAVHLSEGQEASVYFARRFHRIVAAPSS